jgi:hypothetical protein
MDSKSSPSKWVPWSRWRFFAEQKAILKHSSCTFLPNVRLLIAEEAKSDYGSLLYRITGDVWSSDGSDCSVTSYLEGLFVWAMPSGKMDSKKLDTSEGASEVHGKFWNACIVMEQAGDQLDRSCEKYRSVTESRGGKECPRYGTWKEG